MFIASGSVHFIGIGGVGMSGIAECLLSLGFKVSGSDISNSPTIEKLRKAGARIFIGHRPSNLDHPTVVVVSSAIKSDNVELKAALSAKIPVISRAEMLAELMRLKKGIAVAGTHGKTTTTSLIGSIFQYAGLDPTTIVGGRFLNIKGNARYGKGEYLICEADESDGSFLHLSPVVAIVTNIDNDHMDYYQNEDKLIETFRSFIRLVPFYGFAVVCGDDPNVRKAIVGVTKNIYTYGFNKKNDFVIVNKKIKENGMSFKVLFKKKSLGEFFVKRFGDHVALNSIAAVASSFLLGVDILKIRKGLASFQGVSRRMENIGNACKIEIYDDYAHHPTEIKATLSSLLMMKPENRKIGIFQPHRYTRTKLLQNEFALAFKGLDLLFITDIYPASEKPIEGISGRNIFSKIKGIKKVFYIPEKKEIAKKVLNYLQPKDVVITIGAGDIYKTAYELLELLKEKEKK